MVAAIAKMLSTKHLRALQYGFKGHVLVRGMCYESRKVDVVSAKTNYMFDTHALVKALQVGNFTTEQAETLTLILAQVFSTQMDQYNKTMVTKPQQEIMLQQIMSHIAALKKDMIILEKSEFSNLKHDYEKQNIEVKQMKQTLMDELTKLRSSVSLDMSLERARAKEDHSMNRSELEHIKNKIAILASENEKELAKLDNKIDKEIATLLATYERYRNDIMKYAAGTVMTCLTLLLGFYRLWAR